MNKKNTIYLLIIGLFILIIGCSISWLTSCDPCADYIYKSFNLGNNRKINLWHVCVWDTPGLPLSYDVVVNNKVMVEKTFIENIAGAPQTFRIISSKDKNIFAITFEFNDIESFSPDSQYSFLLIHNFKTNHSYPHQKSESVVKKLLRELKQSYPHWKQLSLKK